MRVATQKLDGEATDGVDDDEDRKGGAFTPTSDEAHGSRGRAQQGEHRFVELRGMHGQARRPQGNEAPPGVVQRRQTARGESHGPRQRARDPVVTPGDEAAHTDERKPDARADRQAIQKRRQRLPCPPEVQGRSAGTEDEATVGSSARMEDRSPGSGRDRSRHGEKRFEEIAAGQCSHVGTGQGGPSVLGGSTFMHEVQRDRRSEDGGDGRELEVLGDEPRGQAMVAKPRGEGPPHGRLR